MTITATELKNDLSKYLHLAENDTVFVSMNGKTIVKISPAFEDKIAIANSLVGILPNTVTDEEGREERMKKHEILD